MLCQKRCYYLKLIFFLLTPMLTFFLVEWLQAKWHSPLGVNFWFNMIFYYGTYLLLHGLTNSLFWSTTVLSVLFGVLAVINHFMIAIRAKALLPWEFFALTTVENLAGDVVLKLNTSLVSAVCLIIIICVCAFLMRRTGLFKRARYITLVTGLALLVCLCNVLWSSPKSISNDPWYTVDASRQNGMAVNLIFKTKDLINPKPAGYSPARVREIIGEDTKVGTEKPDIIAIMDESFADLSQIADLCAPHDFMPFTHSLSENTISGTARVSVFGGGTCNTEYEFLTGNAVPLLRVGSYPMVQFVKNGTPSIAKTLKSEGYKTIGLHSFYPDGWNRDIAYPNLGFDKFYCNHDFENPEYVREYISDSASFEKIIDILEEEESPTFIFNVTMQNHFGYDREFDNLKETAQFPEREEFPQTRRYLSLIRLTDRAIQELVEYLEKREKPTILLFFGDHFPAIEQEYYDILKERGGLSDEEMKIKTHSVPFFIWANYDIEERENIKISASFLSPLLLDTAGVYMSEHQNYLRRLMAEMPIWEEGSGEVLEEYKIVQYNMVFDRFSRQGDLFE